jgi:odorant receptor
MVSKVPLATVEDFIKLPLSVLQFVGFNLQQGKASLKLRIFFWAVIVNLLAGIASLTMNFVMNSNDRDKLEDMILTAQQMSYALLALAKAIGLIFMSRGKLAAILADLDCILKEANETQLRDDITKLLKKLRKKWSRILAFYVIATMNAICIPLMTIMYQLISRQQVELRLPLKAWYPVDDTQVHFYILCYLHQVWIAVTLVGFIAGSDCLFSTLMSIVCLRFDGLRQEIRMVKVYEDVKCFVEKHSALIEVCEKLEKSFSPLILFNILVATSILCFQVFVLTVRTFEKTKNLH